MRNMETAIEVNLREAEARAHLAENLITAATVLNDAGVPGDSPQAHRLFHEIVRLPDGQSMRSHLEAQGVRPLRESAYTPAARKLLAKQGKARPDGSYPITKAQDVEDAVDDFNRSGGSPEDKAHIIARAKAVPGGTDKLPADWDGSTRLQESARELRQLGIPTLGDGAQPARLREATSADDLARAGVPLLDEAHAQQQGSVDPSLDGIPMLGESPGLHHVPFTESDGGAILLRIA
jgi:hypothetical protein